MLCRFKIRLVTQNNKRKVAGILDVRRLNKSVTPGFQLLKGGCLRHILHKHASVCSPVKSCAQALIAFLSCGVPNLKSHQLVPHLNIFGAKVSPDCGLVLTGKLSSDKTLHQRSLPHTLCTQYNNLLKRFVLRKLAGHFSVFCCAQCSQP